MSRQFQPNRGPGASVVFQGAYSLPAVGAGNGPAFLEWVLPFKFSKPFVYAVSNGDLLLELHNADAYSGPQYYYPVSGAMSGRGGTVRYFGQRGKFPYIKPPLPFPDQFWIQVRSGTSWPNALTPGSSLRIELPYVPTGSAFLMLGLGRTTLGPIQLPLDLTALGAPGNSLYIRPDVIVPMQMTNWGRPGIPNWVGHLDLKIPGLKSLEGQVFHGQALLIDAKSNALGLVFSNAASIAIGSTQVEVEMLWGKDTDSSGRFYGEDRNGNKWLYGGPIARFHGAFQ